MPDDQLSSEDFEKKYGFPPKTAWRDMPAEQQVSYWQYHSRNWEDRARTAQNANVIPADYDDFKKKAEAHDKWQAENQTEQEKALKAAREDGFNAGKVQAAQEANGSIVQMAFAATGNKQLEALGTVIDTTKFVGTNGLIDQEKLKTFVAGFTDSGNGQQNNGNGQQNNSGGTGEGGQPDPNNQQGQGNDGGQAGTGTQPPDSFGQGKQGAVQPNKWDEGAEIAKQMFANQGAPINIDNLIK